MRGKSPGEAEIIINGHEGYTKVYLTLNNIVVRPTCTFYYWPIIRYRVNRKIENHGNEANERFGLISFTSHLKLKHA